MTITGDILETYRVPREVILRKTEVVREDRALATLMGACLLIFVAQLPWLAREAHFRPEEPLDARMAGALMGVMFLLPLVAYVLAGISHIMARALGGTGTGFDARMALFWALLASAPMFLLMGLLRGFLGQTTAVVGTGVVMLVVFLALWLVMLRAVEAR
jgi:hypothetical protein